MHAAALDWVDRTARWLVEPREILDIGGRDINGNPEHLFHPASTWEVVDLQPGPRVTLVGDVLDYQRTAPLDVVLCLEVAEHTPTWPQIIEHAADLLAVDGVFIFTAAGPGRAPHSAIDGGELREGEHYANISPEELRPVLHRLFGRYDVDVAGDDIRATAWEPIR